MQILMIPDHKEILVDLNEYSYLLVRAAKTSDASQVYQQLANIERCAAFYKQRMMSKMVIDLNEDRDDDL